MKNEASLPE